MRSRSTVCNADNLVKVNGRDPVRVPSPGTTTGCLGPHKIAVSGGPGANTIDLTGVTQAAFTNLGDAGAPPVTISGGDGVDTVTGSELSDVINGDDGDDTLVSNNGAGSDEMDGGAGTDTVENNGSGRGATADEIYTAKTVAGGVRFSRTSAGAFDLLVIGTERYVNNMLGVTTSSAHSTS